MHLFSNRYSFYLQVKTGFLQIPLFSTYPNSHISQLVGFEHCKQFEIHEIHYFFTVQPQVCFGHIYKHDPKCKYLFAGQVFIGTGVIHVEPHEFGTKP
jgi:hypothetical protein